MWKKTNLSWIIAILLVLPFSYSFSYPILYYDRFDNTSLNSNWTLGGGCAITSTTSKLLKCEAGLGANSAIFNHLLINMTQSRSNWSLEFDFKLLDFTVNSQDFLQIKTFNGSTTPSNNYVGLKAINLNTDEIGIIKEPGAAQSSLYNMTNQWKNVRFVFYTNSTIEVYINQTVNTSIIMNLTANVTFFSTSDNGNYIPFEMDNFLVYNTSDRGSLKKLNISVFQEGSTSLITSPVNFILTSENFYYNVSSSTGSVIIQNLESQDYELTISSSGFSTRKYNLNNNIFEDFVTDYFNGYLLNASGVSTTFTIRDKLTQNVIEGVHFETYDTLGTQIIKVDERESDISGDVIISLDQNNEYIFNMTKVGYNSKSFTLQPTQTSYDLELEPLTSGSSSPRSLGINYSFTPTNVVLFNNTAYNFTFNISSSFWDITSCTLLLKNQTNTFDSSSSSFNTRNCNIQITAKTGKNSTIISIGNIVLNSTYNISFSYEYTIKNPYRPYTLKSALDRTRNTNVFNDFAKMFIAFILTFIAVGIAAKSGGDYRDPEVLIIITWVCILFFSYIGWLTLRLDSIPDIAGFGKERLQQYVFFFMFSLFASAYIIERHR